MKKFIVTSLMTLTVSLAFAGPGPGSVHLDPCGSPLKLYYVSMVTTQGILGCGDSMADFSTTIRHGSVSRLNGLEDSNLYYSVLVQDPSTGKSLSAVVKCDVSTGKPSLLSLGFAAITSYGGCSINK